MLNSQVLEVGVGLVLCFLLVSLILTATRETIETFMRTRTTDLERVLAEMLDDREGTGLRNDFFEHPLIRGLYRGTYDGTSFDDKGNTLVSTDVANKPTYIPARQFAMALIDLAETETIDANSPVAGALASMSKAVDGDFERLRTDVEAWYNDAMERATGWYRRRTQWMLLTLGLVVAVGLNVNAVIIAQALSTNATLRTAVADQATKLVEQYPNGILTEGDAGTQSAPDPEPGAAENEDGVAPTPPTGEAAPPADPTPPADVASPPEAQDEGTTPPEPAMGEGAPAASQTPPADAGSQPDAAQDDEGASTPAEPTKAKINPNVTNEVQDLVAELELPIGWSQATLERMTEPFNEAKGWQKYAFVVSLVAGYLITGLAATLGAPFWFDVLSKLTTIRSTVKPKSVPADAEGKAEVTGAATPAAGTASGPARAKVSGAILNRDRDYVYG